MQREVDAITRQTLKCYDDGAIEEEELAAFGLVLELFNHSMVERRAALQTGPVCTENLVRVDDVTELPKLAG